MIILGLVWCEKKEKSCWGKMVGKTGTSGWREGKERKRDKRKTEEKNKKEGEREGEKMSKRKGKKMTDRLF